MPEVLKLQLSEEDFDEYLRGGRGAPAPVACPALHALPNNVQFPTLTTDGHFSCPTRNARISARLGREVNSIRPIAASG